MFGETEAALKTLLSASVTGCLVLTSSLPNTFRCLPIVVVVQAIQHRARCEPSVDRRCFWSARDALLDPPVRSVFPTLQTPCLRYETVFLYWMLFSHSFGCGLFIRILMGHYPLFTRCLRREQVQPHLRLWHVLRGRTSS